MGFVLFIMFFCMGIAILLSIPIGIIVLFFPDNHKWNIALEKFFKYEKNE